MLGFVLLLPVLGGRGMAAAAGAALLLNALVLPRTALGRALRREGERPFGGLLTYPLGVLLAFLLLPPAAAAGGWAALALGDPAAGLVGGRFGGAAPLPWNRRKSWPGLLACGTASWAGMLGVLAALGALGAWPLPPDLDGGVLVPVLAWTLAGAAAAALAESLDLGLDDNLPVILAAGGTLALLAGSAGAG